jgi:hypothetical protein
LAAKLVTLPSKSGPNRYFGYNNAGVALALSRTASTRTPEAICAGTSSDIGRADLVFEDRHGLLLIIELKRGNLPRGAIDQLLDYFGMMKLRFPQKAVALMVEANVIPPERQLTCESYNIGCRPIAKKTFRDVAAEVCYTFASESSTSLPCPDAPASSTNRRHTADQEQPGGWSFSKSVQLPADAQDFLSRCDGAGGRFLAALFEAQKAASSQTRITWNHQRILHCNSFFIALGSLRLCGDSGQKSGR